MVASNTPPQAPVQRVFPLSATSTRLYAHAAERPVTLYFRNHHRKQDRLFASREVNRQILNQHAPDAAIPSRIILGLAGKGTTGHVQAVRRRRGGRPISRSLRKCMLRLDNPKRSWNGM